MKRTSTVIRDGKYSFYFLIPKSVLIEKEVKEKDEFVVLKNKNKNIIIYKRINSEINEVID